MDAHQAGSLEREGKRRCLSCNKALVLLVSSKRTEQQEAASGLRLVTKDIIDGLAEADAAAAEKFTTVHNLKDFVLDPPRTGKKLQYALAIACSKSATEGQAELIVEQLQLLREADVDVATKCMRIKTVAFLRPPVRRICCSTHYSCTTPCVPSSYSLSYCFSIPRVCTQRVMFLAVALYNSIAPKGSEILRGGGLLHYLVVRTRALALLRWQRGTLPRTAVQTYFHNCIAPIPLCVCMCACMRVSLRVSLRVPAQACTCAAGGCAGTADVQPCA